MERQSFTCSNPKCASAFTIPLIVENLSFEDKALYHACPHCLAGMVTERSLEGVELKQSTTVLENAKPGSQQLEIHPCPYNFGYLSHHLEDEEIPEVCLTCRQLLRCACAKPPKRE